MKRYLRIFFLATAFLLVFEARSGENPLNLVSHKYIHDFLLRNIDGNYVAMSDYPSAKGFIIVFTCNHCPFAKLYPERLNSLNEKYKSQGVPLLAINSIDSLAFEEETLSEMKLKSLQNKFSFPYLQDPIQSVAKDFGAQKTPHAFVLWKEKGEWVIRYQGAIDDNGAEPENVRHPFVEEAVDALLNDQTVKNPETNSVGCAIQFRK
ncbi:MAG: thioredoxin family protein [Saprospiraceae bacterium]